MTEKDYFRGVPSILNSEVAAIAFAKKIFAECEEKDIRWADVDFGPTSDDPESDEYVD